MAHTLCQACVLTPQSLQVTLTLRVSVRTDREEDGALLLQQALALTPDPLRRSCQDGSTSLSDVILPPHHQLLNPF